MDISAAFTARYSIAIAREDGDLQWQDVRRQHTKVARMIRPTMIVTDYIWSGFGYRSTWDHSITTISGPSILRDGSDGAVQGQRYHSRMDMPEWARTLVRTAAQRLPDLGDVK